MCCDFDHWAAKRELQLAWRNCAMHAPLLACCGAGLKMCEGPKYSHQLSIMLTQVHGNTIHSAEVRKELQAQTRMPAAAPSAAIAGSAAHCAAYNLSSTPPLPFLSCVKAQDMEMNCLKKLNWRLGPYCCAPAGKLMAGC